MREINFRAWADGKMHYPTDEMWWYISPTGYWSLNIGNEPGEIICDSLDSKNPVLIEYTGINDESNNKIYDGDIVEFAGFYYGDCWEKGGIGVVEYEDDGFGVYRLNGDYTGTVFDMVCNHSAVVVGNQYEDPELLEAE